MLKALAYLLYKSAVASLLQWFSSAWIAKHVFRREWILSSRKKLILLCLMIVGNSALLFIILWGDIIRGPDFVGRQFLSIAYFSYIRLALALCVFFAALKVIAFIFVPLESTPVSGEAGSEPDGPRVTEESRAAPGMSNPQSSHSGNHGREDRRSAQDGTGIMIRPSHQRAVGRISRRGFLRGVGAAGLIAGTGTMTCGLSEAYQRPVLSEFEIPHQSLKGLRKPITIIQVTDFHFGWFWGAAELKRLVGMLNSIKADAVVLTGDIFHSRHGEVESSEPILGNLIPRQYGNFVVMGNHELYVGADRSLASFRRSNLTHIGNRWVSLEGHGAVIQLGGLDDQLAEWEHAKSSAMFERLISKSPRNGGMRVLLCHRPSILPPAAYAGIELVLAGHTHGGQMIIPWPGSVRGLSPAALFSPYTHGWYSKLRCNMYLNRGIGLVYAPWRINCPPEIGIFHFMPPQPEKR